MNTSFLPFSFSVEMGKTEEIYKFLPHTVGKKSFIDTWITQKSLKFAKMGALWKKYSSFYYILWAKKEKITAFCPIPSQDNICPAPLSKKRGLSTPKRVTVLFLYLLFSIVRKQGGHNFLHGLYFFCFPSTGAAKQQSMLHISSGGGYDTVYAPGGRHRHDVSKPRFMLRLFPGLPSPRGGFFFLNILM